MPHKTMHKLKCDRTTGLPVVSRLLCEAESLSGLQMTVPWESEEKWDAIDSW